MRNESIAEFINRSRSLFTRQEKGAAPKWGAASKEARQKASKEEPRTKWGGSKQESKEGPDPVVGPGVSGRAQVTAACDKLAHTADLPGALPHEPHPPRRKKPKRKDTKDELLHLRIKSEMKDKIKQRAEAVGSYPTAYALEILVAGLGLPIDEYALARNKDLKEAHFKNTVALNRVGNLLNQIEASVHRMQPCPLTQTQVEVMLADHAAACKAHLKTGLVNDN